MVATQALLIAASALGAMAAPALPPMHVSPGIELPNGPGRFGQKKASGSSDLNVRAIPNPKFKPDGKRALQRVLAKYNLNTPDYLREIVRRDGGDGHGTVNAQPGDDDIEYLCEITIGDDKHQQKFNLDFDTGSADLWVFSDLLPKSQQSGHRTYKSDSRSSSATKMSGSSWRISYGDGSSASGDVYTDAVTIGGLTVQKQAIELAKKVSSSFVSDTLDGLVGLAFSSINQVSPRPQKTFLENVMSQLDEKVLTADLKHQETGTYEFGNIDKSKYTGEITYTDVDNSQGFWEFDAGNGATAIADTGTTLLLMSNSIVKKYYSKVKGAKLDNTQGGYTFPCNTKLNDLTVTVGDGQATIPGKYLNYAPVSEGSSTCFGGLQGYDGNMYIYGDIFLKAFYSIFDFGNTRFGWASKP
ncbi:Penicillopepsin [Drechslerella dactyloides]|uniref:Penicillopepsin n=1 Tax=Drechslerella dactyloides TaxID=74499 RepID=A0AAD6IQ85_DREDA|nr:Penicillopepsin [Drechslerella dactyloides]